jgi:AmmeMemoRadiSam system protein B
VDKPQVRKIEILPLRGGKVILRDPFGISENTLIIDEEFLYLIFLMDGTRDLNDLQVEWMRKYGVMLFSEQIEEFIKKLDENYMLNNERFLKKKMEMEEEFRSSDVREPALMGKAYPSDERELRIYIERIMSSWGSEKFNGRALIVPHIDLERGKSVYAKGFSCLKERRCPEIILLIGTAHFAEDEAPFILTMKDFLIPFGRIRTDKNSVKRINDLCGLDLCKEEFAFKNEHSVEFPLLFLSFLYGTGFEVIPLLVNSFDRFVEKGIDPSEDESFKKFFSAVKEVLKGRDFLCICAADLSHLGPRFGDPQPLGISELSAMEAIDTAIINSIQSGNPSLLFREIETIKNRTRVCGFPPIYTLLSIIENQKGRLISYEYAYSPDDGSAVSFSAIAFD